MSQVMYAIWIWELYLTIGDLELLRRHHQPLLRSLGYIERRTNADGIVRQVDQDDWQISEGADWVDWCPERMEGSTCVYHTWYARALQYCVQIFRQLGDEGSMGMARDRLERQRRVLNTHFWNGSSYYDNLNFAGKKVNHFWCDSQIWPIAFGFASDEQRSKIFGRIDAQPEVFEGMPLRWCAPLTADQSETRYPEEFREPALRPMSWFGRLGAGDAVARSLSGQSSHAYDLLSRYSAVIADYGSFPECLDMQGKVQEGSGGESDYLEHAGGLLFAVARALWGLDDTADGTLVWQPMLPSGMLQGTMPFRHKGHCWLFGVSDENYWVDPRGATETIQFRVGNEVQQILLKGKRVTVAPRPQARS